MRFHELNLSQPFTTLDEEMYQRVAPTALADPRLLAVSSSALELIELTDTIELRDTLAAELAGGSLPPTWNPIATGYAGHQFGVLVPQLGDGRAILLGEVQNSSGTSWELQVKGAGRTRYSRFGDGRAVLRSTIREFLASEAMAGLNIPTTRAGAIVVSRELAQRETLEPTALLLRIAPTHIRFGTFEYWAIRNRPDLLRKLADYVIDRYYPDLAASADRYPLWLSEITTRTARLVASWMAVGWSHGVLNTDNMSILGLTLDYGPYGFMNRYNRHYICNHSDHTGRYAFDQQPGVVLWNLTRFAESVLSLTTEADALAALNCFQPEFEAGYLNLMSRKLGLVKPHPEDGSLIWDLLRILQETGADYTTTFRELGNFDSRGGLLSPAALHRCGISSDHLAPWAYRYAERLRGEGSDDRIRGAKMARINPVYILRNHLAERAIRRAQDHSDPSEIETLLNLLSDPYTERIGLEDYAAPPPKVSPELIVSCSS